MSGIMEAVKKGFVVSARSLNLVLVMIVFNLVWNLGSLLLPVTPGVTPPPDVLAASVIFTALFILSSIFMQGGALSVVRDSIKEGKTKLALFASNGLKYYLRLLGVGILIIALMAIVAAIAVIIVVATVPINNDVVTAIAIVIAIAIAVVAGLLYFIPFALSTYAVVCDELGVIAAMKKAIGIARPITKAFLLVLLVIVLILISFAITFPAVFVSNLIAAAVPVMIGKIVTVVIMSIVNGYVGIVMMAGFMTYYFHLSKGKTA